MKIYMKPLVFVIASFITSLCGAEPMVSFNQSVSKIESNEVIIPAVVPAKVETLFYRLDEVGIQKLKKEILDIRGLSDAFSQLITDRKTVVLYNSTEIMLVTFTAQDRYTVFLEGNKRLINFLMNMKLKEQLSHAKPGGFTGGGPINEGDLLDLIPGGSGVPSGGGGGGGGCGLISACDTTYSANNPH